MTFKEWFKKRLHRQGLKIERRFRDKPISKEGYEKLMCFIGALIVTYLVFSLMCVIKVIGEWFV